MHEKGIELRSNEIQSALSVMGQVFAEAFATYTAALLRRLSSDDPKGGANDMLRKLETLAKELAPTDQEKDHNSNTGTQERVTIDELRPIMMRNKLVLELRSRGITQADLARKVGKAPAAISRILKHPERSRLTTLQEIAKAVDIDLSELL